MTQTTTTPIPLLHGSSEPRSRATLMRRVDRGELVRLRPGVFVETSRWSEARRWQRHLALVAAAGVAVPDSVICRETALAVYGIPFLRSPSQVHLRTVNRGHVGLQTNDVGPPLRRVPPPVPLGSDARTASKHYLAGEKRPTPVPVEVPGVVLSSGAPIQVKVEPLPFVLVDTLPRLPREQGVVALDAARAGRYRYGISVGPKHLEGEEHWLWSKKAGRAWEELQAMADPRSESPGESWSRVLLQQLGFLAPELQSEVVLPGGDRVRVDFHWPGHGIIGEFDGRIKYSRAQQLSGQDPAEVLYQEKLREDALRAAGFRIVRWSWEDLKRPQQLAAKLMAAGVPHSSTAHLLMQR